MRRPEQAESIKLVALANGFLNRYGKSCGNMKQREWKHRGREKPVQGSPLYKKGRHMTDNGTNQVLDEIRSQIQRTEAEMVDTLDAIQERLSLDYFMHQAEEKILNPALKEAGVFMEKANQVAEELRDRTVHMFRQNPLPVAFIGLGLGWLVLRGLISAPDDPTRLPESTLETTPFAGDTYKSGADESGKQGYPDGGNLTNDRPQGGFFRFVEHNIFAIGAAGLLLGAGAGLILPKVHSIISSRGISGGRFSETPDHEVLLEEKIPEEQEMTEYESPHTLGEVQAEGPYATQMEQGV